jgi:hypothetical protein
MSVLVTQPRAMQVLTKRGKHLQKHYTVFICTVKPDVRDVWEPVLNEEHSEFQWIEATTLRAQSNMHPVTELVLKDHWEDVKNLISV